MRGAGVNPDRSEIAKVERVPTLESRICTIAIRDGLPSPGSVAGCPWQRKTSRRSGRGARFRSCRGCACRTSAGVYDTDEPARNHLGLALLRRSSHAADDPGYHCQFQALVVQSGLATLGCGPRLAGGEKGARIATARPQEDSPGRVSVGLSRRQAQPSKPNLVNPPLEEGHWKALAVACGNGPFLMP
jgi:hypothetical protein